MNSPNHSVEISIRCQSETLAFELENQHKSSGVQVFSPDLYGLSAFLCDRNLHCNFRFRFCVHDPSLNMHIFTFLIMKCNNFNMKRPDTSQFSWANYIVSMRLPSAIWLHSVDLQQYIYIYRQPRNCFMPIINWMVSEWVCELWHHDIHVNPWEFTLSWWIAFIKYQ